MRMHKPIFLLLLAAILTAHFSASPAEPPTAPPPDNAAEFIRESCETTLYPELCYQSLSGYAAIVQQDPARLAGVAISVSLAAATRMTIYIANLSRTADYGANHRAGEALDDCLSVFRDAVEQMRGSLKQMRRLMGTGEELRFQMSNVQTWMSAAITNEDTCMDGFEEVGDVPMKMDVCDRTVKVKEVTSNGLALVNSYAAKVTSP